MSKINEQMTRIENNIQDSYNAVDTLGGTLPTTLNTDNLALAILSIGNSEFEHTSNKITTITTSSTDVLYPSAKAVVDYFKEGNISPIATKTYTGLLASANTTAGADFVFADIVPNNADDIWAVKFKVDAFFTRTNDSVKYTSSHIIELTGYGNTYTAYKNWNSIRNSSYCPVIYDFLYYNHAVKTHAMYMGITLNGAANSTVAGNGRTITVSLLTADNCTVTLHNSPANTDYATYYTGQSMASRTQFDMVTNGLQETSDANHIDRHLDVYYRPYAGSLITSYKICLRGADNRVYPVTTTSGNGTSKAVQTEPLRPDEIWYYNSTTTTNAGAVVPASIMYSSLPVTTLLYSFNANSPAYTDLYLCGNLNSTTGLFTLATTNAQGQASITDYYRYVPNNLSTLNYNDYFISGRYYILVGSTRETAGQCSIFETHPMYYYDGTNLISVITQAQKVNGHTVDKDVPGDAKFTDTTYSDATTSAHGLMSTSDKTKLNGIASGAEVNQNAFSNVTVGSTTISADSKTDTLTLVAGSNVTLTPDATNDKITIAATNTVYTHPAGNAPSKTSGLYKFSTDSTSHINGVTAVTKSDITGLGIPALDTTYTFDGTYNASTNKAATVSTVTNAINALDGTISGTPGASKTLTAFSETDGKVSATFGNISITKSQVSDLGTIGTAAAKGVDTSISDGSTSTNLPTSKAVVDYISEKTLLPEIYHQYEEPTNPHNNDIWISAEPPLGPLRFTAVEAGSTFRMRTEGEVTPNVEYSTNGVTWSPLGVGVDITLANIGDYAMFRGDGNPISLNDWDHTYFTMTGKIAASGSVESLAPMGEYAYYGLFDASDFEPYEPDLALVSPPTLPSTTLATSCYESMFSDCTALTEAPELPATTLAKYCYAWMFYGCTSLTEAPYLTATTLAPLCYSSMFYNCTSLVTAPELPATTLADYCYDRMFDGCSSLTEAPELPATTLADYCYQAMFRSTGLTTAPELPATTLTTSCYTSMFAMCSGLTSAPYLPATELVSGCYERMFQNATSLNNISVAFTSWTGTATLYWVTGVSERGTFTCPSVLPNIRGNNNIPNSWTIVSI